MLQCIWVRLARGKPQVGYDRNSADTASWIRRTRGRHRKVGCDRDAAHHKLGTTEKTADTALRPHKTCDTTIWVQPWFERRQQHNHRTPPHIIEHPHTLLSTQKLFGFRFDRLPACLPGCLCFWVCLLSCWGSIWAENLKLDPMNRALLIKKNITNFVRTTNSKACMILVFSANLSASPYDHHTCIIFEKISSCFFMRFCFCSLFFFCVTDTKHLRSAPGMRPRPTCGQQESSHACCQLFPTGFRTETDGTPPYRSVSPKRNDWGSLAQNSARNSGINGGALPSRRWLVQRSFGVLLLCVSMPKWRSQQLTKRSTNTLNITPNRSQSIGNHCRSKKGAKNAFKGTKRSPVECCTCHWAHWAHLAQSIRVWPLVQCHCLASGQPCHNLMEWALEGTDVLEVACSRQSCAIRLPFSQAGWCLALDSPITLFN